MLTMATSPCKRNILQREIRRYMAEILPLRRKTLFNQSTNVTQKHIQSFLFVEILTICSQLIYFFLNYI